MSQNNGRYEKMFKDQPVWKSILSMSVPALLTIVIMIFYNLADMFFIAQTGDTAKVASISIITPVFNIIMALATMIGAGGSTLIANAFGKDDTEKAKDIASLCFYSIVGFSVVLTVLLMIFQTPLLHVLGTKPEMWADSERYLQVLSCGTVFMMISSAMGMLLRAEGAVKESMLGNLAGTVTNIILDPIFILGFGWGVTGAAIATIIGNVISTIYYLVYVERRAAVMSFDPGRALRQPSVLLPILALGLPNAASTFLSGFASTFSNGLLAQHGTDAIAAAAAAGKIGMLISMVQMGICMGVQPLMAYNYGGKNMKRLDEVLKKTGILTIGIGIGTMLLCFLLRHQIMGLFLKDEQVSAMGIQYMLYVMAGAPFLGVVYISTNYLQAAKKATDAIVVSLLRQGLLLIPLLFLMHAIAGFYGIACAHMAADLAAAVIAGGIFLYRYRKMKEMHT